MKKIRTVMPVLAALLMMLCLSARAEESIFEPQDLPVVYLHIDGGQAEIDRLNSSPDHSYRCTGSMDIIVPADYSGQFEGRYPQESVEGLKIHYIRGRGNGTWGMEKLPYKIKLEDKADLFGMGKSKTWVLLANFFDDSLIRNWLTEWLGDQMGLEYTPQGVFVELVMDGKYLGSYYLCEQVELSKSRVNLDQLTSADTGLPEIQGGYLLEFCPDDETPDVFETSRRFYLGNMDPSFDPADGGYENDAQKNYIRDYIQQAEDAIYADGGRYEDYLDLQSLADYWWIMEFAVNGDAFRTDSAHLFKPRYEADGSEGRLHFGPLWDFDESWGNAMPETRLCKGFNNTTFTWIDELRKKPEFLEYLKERWQVMDGKLEEIVREGGVLDQAAAIVRASWQRDDALWHDLRPNGQTGRDFEQEIEHIRTWVSLRREWINENLDRLGLLTLPLTIRIEGQEDRVFDAAADSFVDVYMIEAPEIEGKEFIGWADESGALVDFIEMDQAHTVSAVYE